MTRIPFAASFLLAILLAVPLAAQTSSAPATRPVLTDIDAALAQNVTDLAADRQPLEKLVASLADRCNTNIVINWPALEAAGIQRSTPLTLQLRNTSLEQILKALCEIAPAQGTRLNYLVGGGAVEITTDEQLAAGSITRLADLTGLLNMQLAPASAPPPAPITDPAIKAPPDPLREARGQKILTILHAELARIGERSTGKDRELLIKSDTLVATQSRRALLAIARVLRALKASLKPGAVPPGVIASVRQKKAEEQMVNLLREQENNPPALQTIAEGHAKLAPDLNVVVLPGVPLGTDPDGPLHLDYLVNDAGIVTIGRAADIRARTLFAVYDLRDLIKRLSLKPENKNVSPAELSARIVATLKKNVTPDIWSDLGKGPCSLTEYEGLLVVFAPPPVYRALGATWKDAEK